MSILSVVLGVVALAVAALWATVGVLGLRGALPRNRWVGVRTDTTMRSADAFTLANRVAAPGTLGAAAILLMGGALTLGVDDTWAPLFTVVAGLVATGLIGLVWGLGARAAEQSAPSDDGDATCDAGGCASCSLRGACASDPGTEAAAGA